MKKTVTCRKLIAAFKADIEKFIAFMRRANPRTALEEIALSDFDDPYWDPMLHWQGLLMGHERMLKAAGIPSDDITQIKADAGLPPTFRSFRAPHHA